MEGSWIEPWEIFFDLTFMGREPTNLYTTNPDRTTDKPQSSNQEKGEALEPIIQGIEKAMLVIGTAMVNRTNRTVALENLITKMDE
jgi:hypothetical protein